MKFLIIAYLLIIANLFDSAQCLQCYVSVGNISFVKNCNPKPAEKEMCFATKFEAEGLCVRGCSYEILYDGIYEFSLNCSSAVCMDGIGCCCKGDLCNNQCLSGATKAHSQYSTLLALLLSLTTFKFLF